jgi:hypothetical protein
MSFIRTPGSRTLKTRLFAVFVNHSRSTSPARAVSARSVWPPMSSRLPYRPIAA